ncbi:hypothetical protein D3C72_2221760 [compost metagenome]
MLDVGDLRQAMLAILFEAGQLGELFHDPCKVGPGALCRLAVQRNHHGIQRVDHLRNGVQDPE